MKCVLIIFTVTGQSPATVLTSRKCIRCTETEQLSSVPSYFHFVSLGGFAFSLCYFQKRLKDLIMELSAIPTSLVFT